MCLFYTFTHASFPSAALEDVKERLFTSTEVGRDVVGGKKGKMQVGSSMSVDITRAGTFAVLPS